MKTGELAASDVIWTSNVDLLPEVEVLPVIGSCQVSSILSNLDSVSDKLRVTPLESATPVDLEVPITSELVPPPLPVVITQSTDNVDHENYIVLKENTVQNTKAQPLKNELKNGDNFNFEDMLYFVCNLCPFLCTKDEKITQHLANDHKTRSVRKLPHLKCPACANVFFHKMSLRSHLIHDHGVGNSDLTQIIKAVVHFANKAKTSGKKTKASTNKEPKQAIEAPTTENVQNKEETLELSKDKGAINLPKVDINQYSAEKMFNSMMMVEYECTSSTSTVNKCEFPGCKAQFRSAEKMNYHKSCHQPGKGFTCPACNEKFGLWKYLSGHLWREHEIDMELHSCDQCDYKTVSLSKLNNLHKPTHGEVRAFVCNICKKAFKNTKQLSNHKTIHKSVVERSKYKCDICCKGFSERRLLRIHMDVVHEKLRPFLCTYCGYKASSKSSLKMHVRQHTGEKPFACDSCSYTTSDHNSLRRHKLRHSGDKPYKCSYCSYACIQSSTYKVHLKTKHPGLEKNLMFTCSECQFRTVNRDLYISHMLSVHNHVTTTNSS